MKKNEKTTKYGWNGIFGAKRTKNTSDRQTNCRDVCGQNWSIHQVHLMDTQYGDKN